MKPLPNVFANGCNNPGRRQHHDHAKAPTAAITAADAHRLHANGTSGRTQRTHHRKPERKNPARNLRKGGQRSRRTVQRTRPVLNTPGHHQTLIKEFNMKRIIQTAAFILALGVALPALAMGLEEAKQQFDTAKQQGLLGETPAGYLDVVRAQGNAREVAEAINNARREEYTRIAEKHNIPVTQVETVAGKKAIEKTPAGQFVLVDGRWIKK